MTEAYALQIAGVAAVFSAVALTSVWIAARIFDRNTREIERRRQADMQG
ncbi:hypothetical protein [Methylobacterium iners]|uniref:Heme exporter protein D n=1 Tax=Methylobacterium iners TaxID=418707 RepID=A0ABQ4RYA2_9HYPH|nr:hypothetical protein [Methylobacterium iners]GJD95826.1 hypothetical protein OCOJLMKI_3041 [Methylobacterium iners]